MRRLLTILCALAGSTALLACAASTPVSTSPTTTSPTTEATTTTGPTTTGPTTTGPTTTGPTTTSPTTTSGPRRPPTSPNPSNPPTTTTPPAPAAPIGHPTGDQVIIEVSLGPNGFSESPAQRLRLPDYRLYGDGTLVDVDQHEAPDPASGRVAVAATTLTEAEVQALLRRAEQAGLVGDQNPDYG